MNDPNLLACKDWENLLAQLEETKAKVEFNQGLDIRVMTEKKAEALNRIRMKEIHFAWDRYEDKDLVLPKLKMFAEICKTKPHAKNGLVFTLVNHTSTIEQDLERIYTLREIGYDPYIMIYDKEHAKQVYKDMARWVNNRYIFAKCERFEDYKK